MKLKEQHKENQVERLSSNEKFLKRLHEVTDANLKNDKFGVSELAEVMDMSRMQVYRKVRRATGKNASEFIREKRLHYARDLLLKDVGTVSEIAYRAGFGSPAYFNNCYRKYYGHTPGQAKDHQTDSDPNRDDLDGSLLRNRKRIFYKMVLVLISLLLIGSLAFQILTGIGANNDKSIAMVTDKKSIAVLPFYNDSPNQENEYFCNGMMEEILTHLQKISDLEVKSRTAVEAYRNTTEEPEKIGADLGASYLVEGSVRKVDDDIRISVQLIDGKSGDHIWAEIYDGKYTQEIFEFQGNVAKKITASINGVITPEEEKKIDKKPTSEVIAYDLYLRGMQMIEEFGITEDSSFLEIANVYFDKALKLDPDYVMGVFGKGHALKAKAEYYSQDYDSAMFYADKAIQLDPEHPYGYALKGSIYNQLELSDLAIEYTLKALDIEPGHSWANLTLGFTYILQKKDYRKGLPYINESLRSNASARYLIYRHVGMLFYRISDYKRALSYFKLSMDLRPLCKKNITDYINTLIMTGRYEKAEHFMDSISNDMICSEIYAGRRFFINIMRKKYIDAERNFNQLIESGGKPNIQDSILMAFVYKKLKKTQQSNEILNNSRRSLEPRVLQNDTWRNNLYLSMVYAILSKNEKAKNYLSIAADKDFYKWQDLLMICPVYENLWNDPEFKSIVNNLKHEKTVLRAQVHEIIEKKELDL